MLYHLSTLTEAVGCNFFLAECLEVVTGVNDHCIRSI